jgi:hypothetical protein
MVKRIVSVVCLLIASACSPVLVVKGVYAERPHRKCEFSYFSWTGKAGDFRAGCWCWLPGRSADGGEMMIFAKVKDEFCNPKEVNHEHRD